MHNGLAAGSAFAAHSRDPVPATTASELAESRPGVRCHDAHNPSLAGGWRQRLP